MAVKHYDPEAAKRTLLEARIRDIISGFPKDLAELARKHFKNVGLIGIDPNAQSYHGLSFTESIDTRVMVFPYVHTAWLEQVDADVEQASHTPMVFYAGGHKDQNEPFFSARGSGNVRYRIGVGRLSPKDGHDLAKVSIHTDTYESLGVTRDFGELQKRVFDYFVKQMLSKGYDTKRLYFWEYVLRNAIDFGEIQENAQLLVDVNSFIPIGRDHNGEMISVINFRAKGTEGWTEKVPIEVIDDILNIALETIRKYAGPLKLGIEPQYYGHQMRGKGYVPPLTGV